MHAPKLPKPARLAQLQMLFPQPTCPARLLLHSGARAELLGAVLDRSASRRLQQRQLQELKASWMHQRHQAKENRLHMLQSMQCFRRLPASCLTGDQPNGPPSEDEP